MKPKTVDEYIASFPEIPKTKMTELRKILREALPDTTEALKWNAAATIDTDGMILTVLYRAKEYRENGVKWK